MHGLRGRGRVIAAELTQDERHAISALVYAWNLFAALPVEHADDVDEFRHGIHALQDKILARPARRAIQDAGEASAGGEA